MRALFLAGGAGVSDQGMLRSMLPILNKPMLERSILLLADYGVRDFTICTSSRAKIIENYFGDGEKWGVRITYHYETKPLGTGGAIRNVLRSSSETVLVLKTDILYNVDFADFIRYHRRKAAEVTVAAVESPARVSHGFITEDKNGFAVSIGKPPAAQGESAAVNGLRSAGMYIVEPAVFKKTAFNDTASLERHILPMFIKKGFKIAVYKGCRYWMRVANAACFLQAHKDILSGGCRLAGADFAAAGDDVWTEGGAEIDRNAVITGPVYIGNNVKIGAYAKIGPNAVLCDDVSVHLGGEVADSVLMKGTDVSSCAKVFEAAVGPNSKVARKRHDKATTSLKVEAAAR